MVNTTPIYWEANGLSLHTEAWGVVTFGGRRYVPTQRRGDDVQVPFRRGRIPVAKTADSQTQALQMWLKGTDEDGNPDPVLTVEQKMHSNWRKILNAIDVKGQFPLVKRWWADDGSVAMATAQAEFADGMEPSMTGQGRFEFTATLLLADPYYYAPQAAQPVGPLQVLGEVETDHVTLTLSGGTNPRVTFPDGNWVQFNGSPGSTDVVIDLLTGQAKQGNKYVNGLISRADAFGPWPMLRPGAKTLTLSGGGSATVAYDAAYR